VEIRNQLTLELITILQPPETIPRLTGPLAYSPDGRSIACVSDIAIIIWDIQTGGVAKEIECGTSNCSMVWSSDGQRICTIGYETHTVHIYGVSSGAASSPGALQSGGSLHLWPVDESFRVIMAYGGYNIETIDIFEVGSTLTKIQSSPPCLPSTIYNMSFSPTTHHISVSGYGTLSISDVRNSEVLLRTKGYFFLQCFSSDGSLFAASEEDILFVWKYDSGHYALYRKYQFQDLSGPLLFSPTPSSSIMGRSQNTLWVLRLHELPTAPEIRRQQYVGLSRSGTRVATAHRMENTVTTADVLARTPPQFIDTDVAIENLFLTNNVLLVVGSGQVVAWLLTEEGLVDGVIGDRRVGRGDSIWAVPFRSDWEVPGVEGQIGVIGEIGRGVGDKLQVYRTDTGELLHPTQGPPDILYQDTDCSDEYGDYKWSRAHLYLHDLSRYDAPLEDRWQTSPATVREGWVKDAGGKHRLWVPAEWRAGWDSEDWLHDITTQFSRLAGGPVIVKF